MLVVFDGREDFHGHGYFCCLAEWRQEDSVVRGDAVIGVASPVAEALLKSHSGWCVCPRCDILRKKTLLKWRQCQGALEICPMAWASCLGFSCGSLRCRIVAACLSPEVAGARLWVAAMETWKQVNTATRRSGSKGTEPYDYFGGGARGVYECGVLAEGMK